MPSERTPIEMNKSTWRGPFHVLRVVSLDKGFLPSVCAIYTHCVMTTMSFLLLIFISNIHIQLIIFLTSFKFVLYLNYLYEARIASRRFPY